MRKPGKNSGRDFETGIIRGITVSSASSRTKSGMPSTYRINCKTLNFVNLYKFTDPHNGYM